jgi:polyisoprenoid-binding protein YceI
LRKSLLLVIACALLAAPALAQTPPAVPAAPDTWAIDPNHSAASFAVKHMMVSTVRGTLGKVSGNIVWDGKNLASIQADVTIDVAGIDTGVEARDNDLRSDNFFNATAYPSVMFKSRRVEPGADGRFKMVGDLTIKGNTREVTLDVEGPSPPQKTGNRLRTGASATTSINRKEFGLLYNKLLETGGAVVSDDVKITIDLEATRPVAAS